MTIDLGFAWLRLSSGDEVGIVDVPGHRGLHPNRLAGVGGRRGAPCRRARRGRDAADARASRDPRCARRRPSVVALTKRDLVDNEWASLARADVAAALKGTPLSGAPMIEVSAAKRQGCPSSSWRSSPYSGPPLRGATLAGRASRSTELSTLTGLWHRRHRHARGPHVRGRRRDRVLPTTQRARVGGPEPTNAR